MSYTHFEKGQNCNFSTYFHCKEENHALTAYLKVLTASVWERIDYVYTVKGSFFSKSVSLLFLMHWTK